MERSVMDLSKYRYECCKEALDDARFMFENNRYKNCLNRAYYSIFHGIRAVFALEGFDSSKHSGLISHFNKYYVKTGIFLPEASKIIKLASENREHADYLDFFIASKSDAENQIRIAEKFRMWVEEYLKTKGVL